MNGRLPEYTSAGAICATYSAEMDAPNMGGLYVDDAPKRCNEHSCPLLEVPVEAKRLVNNGAL